MTQLMMMIKTLKVIISSTDFLVNVQKRQIRFKNKYKKFKTTGKFSNYNPAKFCKGTAEIDRHWNVKCATIRR